MPGVRELTRLVGNATAEPPGQDPIAQVPVLVFDTETTDRDPLTASIVEVGAVRLVGGGVVDPFIRRVNPGIPIPPEVVEIHGIDDAAVADEPMFFELAPELVGLFSAHTLFAGYNATGYDVPLVNAELRRACAGTGIEPFQVDAGRVLDPLIWARWWWRGARSRKLGALCERLGVQLDNAHSALADVTATAEVLRMMLGRRLIPQNVDRALEVQAHLAAFQQAESERWGIWLFTLLEADDDGNEREVFAIGAGKHCGKPVYQVPQDYVRFVLGLDDLAPDTIRVLNDYVPACSRRDPANTTWAGFR